MPTHQALASLYQASMNELLAVKVDFDSTPEQVAAATAAIEELNRAWIADVEARYQARTASLNLLVERLNAVSASLETGIGTGTLERLRTRLGEAAARVRGTLLGLAHDALGSGDADLPTDPSHREPPELALDDVPPAPRAAPEDVSPQGDVPAPARPSLPPLAAAAEAARPASKVPSGLYDDYSRLFAACLIRPEHLGQINGHLERIEARRADYQRVGDPLGIPWWFVAVVHGLESAYQLDRHLHNGDPLDAPTVRIPTGRPPGWADAADQSWAASARDALTLQGLEGWDDWSVQGALYQWERYNGFGYRKFHPEVLSPYLWSFTNHYHKGKYVADGRFDPEATSAQAGAGAILRQLVNTGQVPTA